MTSWEQHSAKIDVQNRSNLLKIARFSWLASARKRTCVLTVCQQQRWQVLEHCANSRTRAGVGPKSVLTVDVSVLTLERRPCTVIWGGWWRHRLRAAPNRCLCLPCVRAPLPELSVSPRVPRLKSGVLPSIIQLKWVILSRAQAQMIKMKTETET